jgi:PRC-barrel domain
MVSRLIAAAFLATALMTGVASAQTTTTTKDTAATSATMQDEFSAYKLVGVNVYNQGNEKIGEVKDILLQKSGKADKVDEPPRSASGDSKTTTGSSTTTSSTSSSSSRKWYPDHAEINATKDQLKAMPEFKY